MQQWLQGMCWLAFCFNFKNTINFTKTITWTKKSGKGWQKWHKACELGEVPPRKLKTPMKTSFASRVVQFQESFEFKHILFFAMEINNHWFYQVVRLVPKFGHSPNCC
jgi:hypothetical protein